MAASFYYPCVSCGLVAPPKEEIHRVVEELEGGGLRCVVHARCSHCAAIEQLHWEPYARPPPGRAPQLPAGQPTRGAVTVVTRLPESQPGPAVAPPSESEEVT